MPHQHLKPEFTFDKDRLTELKKIIPEAFADGKIKWNTLKENLGEYLEDDGPDSEDFGLFWPGKKQARKIASIPSKGTLVPVYGEGLKANGSPDNDGINDSKNIFIEGENLEVLKILQKSYAGRIKMIYIDPPYNTGNDLIYEDDFKEQLQEYLRRSGQITEEGLALSNNSRADGRFHSKWLSMMFSRLRLARNLLCEDGVIFISIDDNENYYLRAILDEIFGSENFVGVIKRRASRKTAHLSGTMTDMCDYIVIYSKEPLNEPLSVENASDKTRPVFNNGNKVTERIIPKNTQAKCSDGTFKKGLYKVRSLEFELTNDLLISEGRTQNEIVVKGPWRINQQIINQTIYVTKNFGFRRLLLPEEYEIAKALNDLLDSPEFYNEIGSEELENIFKLKNLFDNPKPHHLIKYLIKSLYSFENNEDFIVLDFFAGSGTTGHAVYAFSTENDVNNLKYILVQLPEPINSRKPAFNLGYKLVSRITAQRLKLSSEEIRNNTEVRFDSGFKFYKLSNSNYKDWNSSVNENLEQLEMNFAEMMIPLRDVWKTQDLISEIILIEGFPLDSKIEDLINCVSSNNIKVISSNNRNYRILLCLDDNIHSDTIDELQILKDDIFICLDSSISDQDKVRLADKGMIKTI